MTDEPKSAVRMRAALAEAAEPHLFDTDAHRVAGYVIPYGFATDDDRGKILYATPALEQMFGYYHGELTGMCVDELVASGSRPDHPSYRAAYHDNPMTRPMGAGKMLRGRRKGGAEFPACVGLAPAMVPQRLRLVCFYVMDLSSVPTPVPSAATAGGRS